MRPVRHPASRRPIRAPAHLDCRVHGRQLLDLPKEAVPRRKQLLVCGTGRAGGSGLKLGGLQVSLLHRPRQCQTKAALPQPNCTPPTVPVMCSQGSRSSTGVLASKEGVPSPSRSVPLYCSRAGDGDRSAARGHWVAVAAATSLCEEGDNTNTAASQATHQQHHVLLAQQLTAERQQAGSAHSPLWSSP